MSESVADLFVILRAEMAPLLAGFVEAGASGERMAVQIVAATTEVDAAFARMVAGVEASAAKITASETEAAAATDRLAASAKLTSEEAGASAATMGERYTAMAVVIGEDSARIVTAYGETAVAAQASADKMAASAVKASEANAAMAGKIEADLAAVKVAEGEAAAANEALGAKMAGTDAAMSRGAVAAGTFKSTLADTAGVVGMSGGQLLGLGAAAGVVAVETVKMAGTFEQKMNLIVTQAHAPQSEIDNLKQKVLDLAGATGQSADKLAEGLYHIESVGTRGQAAIDGLAASAKLATIGMASLDDVTYAMSGMMSSGMKDVANYSDGVALLNTIVGQGDMTMQQLSKAIGTGVLPAFKDAGLGAADFGAALATLTDNSVPAEVAANHLKTSVQLLQNQSGPAKKALGELGIGAGQLGKDLEQGGLQQALVDIQSHMTNFTPVGGKVKLALAEVQKDSKQFYDSLISDGATVDEATKATAKYTDGLNKNGSAAVQAGALLSKAFGGARSASTMETLAGEADRFNTKLHTMGDAASRAAQLQADWTKTQENFNVKMSQAKDGLGALAISIGEKLLPAVSAIAGVFATVTTWMSQNEAVSIAVAIIVGGVLVGAFVALAVAVIAATWEFILAGIIIVAVVAGIVWLVNLIVDNWGSISDFFAGIWKTVSDIFTTAVGWIGDRISDIVNFFTNLPGKIGGALASLGSSIMTAVTDAAKWLVQPFVDGWAKVVAFFSQSPRQIGEALGRAAADLVKAGAELVLSIYHGVVSAVTNVYTFFSSTLPNAILGFLVSAARWLLKTGVDIVTGLRDGIVNGYHAVVAWFTALPGNIMSLLVSSAVWLLTTGKSLLDGFVNGIVDGFHAVVSWLVALPGRILSFFQGANVWLVQTGSDIFTGLWNGITGFFGTIFSGIGSFIGGFIDAFKSGLGIASPSTIFLDIGQNVIQGLWNGVVNIWNGFIGFAQTLPSNITNLFADAGNWLVNAGYNVVMGLWNGIQSVGSWLYNAVSSWASGILNAAKSALGIASPSVHTHEMGMYMAQGLAAGLDAHTIVATAAATRMSKAVMAAANPGGLTVGASLTGGSLAATASGGLLSGLGAQAAQSGGTTVHVTVNVAGSVTAEQDLARTIQEQVLQHNVRNTGNGLSYTGFGAGR